MKQHLLLISLALSLSGSATSAEDIKVGVILGFTGPIETLTPAMADAAELAFKEASQSGKLLDGATITPVRADSTCVDAAAATAAMERLVSADNVVAVYGADCSGVTTAAANNVAIPNGVVMVSPSATSPALSSIDDNGYFFRTAPSDARQGEVLAKVVMGRGIKNVAITYTNSDYGKGLSESFSSAYKALGGNISAVAAHEDGKADYAAEVGALSAAGGEALVVFGYLDQGGKGIVSAALDTGGFDKFIFADGMIGQSIIDAIGKPLEGSFGTLPGGDGPNAEKFLQYATQAGFDGDGPFRASSYDAGALLVLAMQAAGNAERASIQSNMMNVANAPGVKIRPGEIAKGLEVLAGGGDVDYVGATEVEFNDVGEVFGTYKEVEVKSGKFETINTH
ncbi:ABC transporter substrate-binding protein [Candidatus Persebacteraceae bacterium Df01]|uniref:ABC transporter substrate-binding protein n=1 Tax=Candidatus Doriopsillibacter californiensis TaxID=2970740 RepID=A0ABT7QL94_9GAMM|nr:ABC transporter substrate-binding protein [Candidatus Persebacteraceae bacterium Df01]